MFPSTIWVRPPMPSSPTRHAAPQAQAREAGRAERDWQRQQIPGHLRTLVLEDQIRRNRICWSVFDD